MEGEKQLNWHALGASEVAAYFRTKKSGLSQEEAKRRLLEYGENTLPKQKEKPWYAILFSQLANPLIFILLLASFVSFFLKEWVDLAVIGMAVFVNTILGFVEEYRADRSLLALQSYLPEKIRARRQGKIMVISAQEVVPGDILLISSGDRITADGRILDAQVFEVNEAALTGESAGVKKRVKPVKKDAQIGDRYSMVFAGTVAVSGIAEVIVTATGGETHFGKITKLVSELEEEKTPLQSQLSRFAKTLGIAVIFLSGIIFFVGVYRGLPVKDIFYTSVAVAVAVVPEGLVVAVTMILAIGMQRMLKKKALVRKLIAAETLGSISVICLDKTGTLTTGSMTVVEVRTDGKALPLDAHSVKLDHIRAGILAANAAEVEIDQETGKEILHGTSTEIALRNFALSLPKPKELLHGTLIAYLPFSHERKFAARSFHSASGTVLYAVGAPDILLDRADLTDQKRMELQGVFEEMTSRGLRVLAVSFTKSIADHKELTESLVQDVEILGFVGIKDPLREEASELVAMAQKAGIHTVMITGDHPETARHIALEAGFDVETGGVVTGAEMDEWSDSMLEDRVSAIFVYARVEPIHKMRIIRAWKAKGASVAMTGDGVNDAPAIKAADIGIALGSGTSVAKESSDMVLLDNNFKTIIEAIREGRTMFDNIRKIIIYLMADSFTAVVLVLGALAFGLPIPLLPAQILIINLVVDGFPYIALAFEKSEKDIMSDPPRATGEPLLNQEMKILIFFIGILTDAILFGIYIYLLRLELDLPTIRTFVYMALGLNTLLYIFAIRTLRSGILSSNPFENRYLLFGVALGFMILISPFYIPALAGSLQMVVLPFAEWAILILFAFGQLALIEIVKEYYNIRRRRERALA